jgi:hypothetical protein
VVRLGLAVKIIHWASWIFAIETYLDTVKLADFCQIVVQIFSYSVIIITEMFCYGVILFRRLFVTGDVLLRRHYVTETLCYRDVLYGDVLSRRRFVRRRFVCVPF